MSKFGLREGQMSEAAYVEDAAQIARSLVARESRGPGDTENAMRRLEARYGVPFNAWWSLRYRKPKAIVAGLYARIKAAHAAECERHLRRLAIELEITKAVSGPDHASVAAAQAVVDAHLVEGE